MTMWKPWLADQPGPLYRRLVMALQRDILSGRLQLGTRLPTHRELARALSITVVTASRAYREAASWGLVRGEVGRGTFVAAAAGVGTTAGTAQTEVVELTANHIALDAAALGAILEPSGSKLLWESLTRRYPPGGDSAHRAAGAAWVGRAEWAPRPAEVVATSGAQHAIMVALAALARPGDLVYVEDLTYPGVTMAARTLGLRLQPLPIDAQGLIPGALDRLCADRPGTLLFCQPSLHNPTSAVMPLDRRREIVALARQHDLTILEDSVYEFLLPDPPPPLAALAPERTCHIISGAKAFVQGLRIGYLIAPEPLIPRLQAEVAATSLAAAPSLLDLATRWIADGSARRMVEAKRREAERRQQIAGACLAGLRWVSHPCSSHLWLELQPPWRVAAFVEQARRQGVEVNPAAAFATDRSTAPSAVRVCLGPIADRDLLASALSRLAEILAAPPPPEEPVV